MIYTLTLNPALDYRLKVKNLRYDDINRSCSEDLHYGGKGINVSVMLTRLGVPNRALGFVAGFTGERLTEMLAAEGVDCAFLKLKRGNTRINVKIKSDTELDINARGPEAGEEETEKLIDGMRDIKKGDFLVIAGSAPENLPGDIYDRILRSLDGKGVNFVVDAAGELLRRTLKYKPFLIKPNHHELGDLFGVKTETESEITEYAAKLKKAGARNVLVSLGERGAILLDENGKVRRAGAVPGEVINTVGCGDSMVAGFLAGYMEKGGFDYALKLGAACGNATAFCETLASKRQVTEILTKL